MAVSQSWKDKNLEDLYKYSWFFGQLSEENAKEILEEAKQNDEKSEEKTIVFLKTSFDDIKQNHFTIVLGHLSQHALNGQPQFYFFEKYPYSILQNLVMRKNPFSLEELVKVKIATSVVDPKTLKLPKRIQDEVKKYHDLNDTSSCIAEVELISNYFPRCHKCRASTHSEDMTSHCTKQLYKGQQSPKLPKSLISSIFNV